MNINTKLYITLHTFECNLYYVHFIFLFKVSIWGLAKPSIKTHRNSKSSKSITFRLIMGTLPYVSNHNTTLWLMYKHQL